MKRRNDAGFSLVEVLVAIAILAAVVLPTCSALVLSVRMNEKTEQLMQAQLAVSSAVETLMAEGIPEDIGNDGDYGTVDDIDRFPDVTIQVTKQTTYYNVEVASDDGLVTVTTSVGFSRGGA